MFGGLDNIVATTNYNEIMDKFNEIEKNQNEANRFQTINRKLLNTQLNDEDLIKTNDVFNAQGDYQKTKSYKDWQVMFPKEGQMQMSYQDFLTKNKDNYTDDYGLAFTTNKTPLSADEITAKRFQKAGLNPNDIMFYSDYLKRKGDIPVDFNKDLTSLLANSMYGLHSRGSEGDRLLNLATQRAAGLMQKAPKPIEWGIYTDGNKNVWQYDKNNPENRKLMTKYDEKPKDDKSKLGMIKSIDFKIDEEKDTEGNPTGKYFYYIPSEKDGQIVWEKTSLDATKKEYDSYMSQFEIDNSTGNPRRRTSGRTRSHSSVSFELPKTPEAMKNVTVEDVSKMTISQLHTITSDTYRKLISEDVYNAAKERLRGGNTDNLDNTDITANNNPYFEEVDGKTKYKEGSILSDKVQKISEKIMNKKEKMIDLQRQRQEVANEFVTFKKAFNSGKFKPEELNKSVMKYITDLENAGYDEEIIQEANDLFEKFKKEL